VAIGGGDGGIGQRGRGGGAGELSFSLLPRLAGESHHERNRKEKQGDVLFAMAS
jgi:hypothetical protein